LAGKRLLENVMGISRIIASRQRTEARYSLLAICGLLFAAYCLLPSCGRKGAPTLKSYEKPDAPSGLEAIHREADIILLWNFPDDKQQSIRRFYLMKSTGGDFKKIAYIKNDTLSVTDTNFKTSKIYKYKVLSESLKGVLSKDSNIVEVRPQKAPLPPGGFSFTIKYNTLTLKWKTAGEGILYNVYKSHKPGVYPLTPLNREPLKEPLFTDTFDMDKIIFYTVRSLLGGTIRDEGAASEEIKIDPFEFVPPSPQGLQAVATEGNVYLLWKEPAETWIKGYRIYREINKKEGFILIGESQTPSFVDKQKPLTNRNYRVTALGPSKEGPPAEIKDVVFSK
jgi:hypothetical protein